MEAIMVNKIPRAALEEHDYRDENPQWPVLMKCSSANIAEHLYWPRIAVTTESRRLLNFLAPTVHRCSQSEASLSA